jgi:hypothetical protein
MPARGDRRWKWQGVMQLRMPRGQVVSPRRRGYAGSCAARQAFFSYFFEWFLAQKLSCRQVGAVVSLRLARAASRAINRREDNPAQIEAEERTSHRAGWERGDACAERVAFGPNQAQ